MFLSPLVWQHDSVQHPDCSQRKHSSAHKAPAPTRRGRPWWHRLGVGCSRTFCFTHQLQPSLGWHPDCGFGGQTWRAFEDRPAGAERRGEVVPGPRPRWGHGQDCVCGFWRYKAVCLTGLMQSSGIEVSEVNKSQHPSPMWDLTAALPVLRGGLRAHSHRGWRGEHHHYLWQLETGEPNNTSPFPQSLLPAPSLALSAAVYMGPSCFMAFHCDIYIHLVLSEGQRTTESLHWF